MCNHRLIYERIQALRLGLLGPEVTAELERQIRECEECAAIWQLHTEENRTFAGEQGHIPARVLASWARTTREVAGARRYFLRRHLVDCDLCRNSLQLVGQQPELPFDAALELAPAQIWELELLLDPGAATMTPRSHPEVIEESWFERFSEQVAAWFTPVRSFAAAAAALLLVAVVGPNQMGTIAGSGILAVHKGGVTKEPQFALPGVRYALLPISMADDGIPVLRLRESSSADSVEAPAMAITTGATTLGLEIPWAEQDSIGVYAVSLAEPGSAKHLASTVVNDPKSESRAGHVRLMLAIGEAATESGPFLLRVSGWSTGATEPQHEYHFLLTRTAAPTPPGVTR